MAKSKKDKLSDLGSKALDVLYPARLEVSEQEALSVDLPAQSIGYFDGYPGDFAMDPVNRVFASTSDEDKLIHELPVERIAKYPFLEAMSQDPTIDCAIKMHIAHALSATDDTGEVLSIESTSDAEDPIVNDLRDTFKDMVNRKVQGWAYTAALLGTNYIRVYGEQGKGVTNLRCDYYTHPRFVREFEQAGRPAGFTTAYHGGSNIRLMAPWAFVPVRVPFWRHGLGPEPYRVDAIPVDLSSDLYEAESIVETQNYGSSLIETGYSPWFDLLEAILSLNMSRKNASRLERLIGVNTGRLDPQQAAKYYNAIAGQIQKTDRSMAKRSLRKGFVQTVLNHIIPVFGDSKGRLDINTLQGTPDIQGLEDVNFHVKRLGSALGIDPSLLGFGEMMSGGLGDGGFFRMSVTAAIKAQALRRAVKDAVERIFEIHVAYKYGKVFLPGEKPWRIMFNAVNTAIEREERENREGRANLCLSIGGIVQTLDPEMQNTNKHEFFNYLFTDIMRVDEEKFKAMFPKEKANAAPPEGEGDGGMFESAGQDKFRAMVFEAVGEFYKEA